MPLKGFKYPDGDVVRLLDVKTGNVDVDRMQVSLPTLLHMSKDRDPDRKPSTTELIQGTCQSYLQRTQDYYIYPDDNAFSLAGTLHHLKLEESSSTLVSNLTKSRLASEITLESLGITGTIDLYDRETNTLVDYKFSGSYKIAKCLGVQVKHGYHPTEVYKKSGRWGKAGTPRRVKEFYIDKDTADMEDWGWQVNFYRYLLEQNGYPVDNMYVQATVRDAGLQIARERGIDKKIYMIEVPYINDEHLLDMFETKRDALLLSLDNEELPDKCTDEETWNGTKCKSYCSVRDICPYNEGE
tara:strand:- start:142 stop:1035 length:894 start_codon:yes stop_codon:yes gene_type:complete